MMSGMKYTPETCSHENAIVRWVEVHHGQSLPVIESCPDCGLHEDIVSEKTTAN